MTWDSPSDTVVSSFHIAMCHVEGCSIQIPVHSRVAIICNLKEYHEAGDHYLYICDVNRFMGMNRKKRCLPGTATPCKVKEALHDPFTAGDSSLFGPLFSRPSHRAGKIKCRR